MMMNNSPYGSNNIISNISNINALTKGAEYSPPAVWNAQVADAAITSGQ